MTNLENNNLRTKLLNRAFGIKKKPHYKTLYSLAYDFDKSCNRTPVELNFQIQIHF